MYGHKESGKPRCFVGKKLSGQEKRVCEIPLQQVYVTAANKSASGVSDTDTAADYFSKTIYGKEACKAYMHVLAERAEGSEELPHQDGGTNRS